MTNLAPLPRAGLSGALSTGRDAEISGAVGHPRVALVTVAVVACLLAGTILTIAAITGIDTRGRLPHPVPLPAPTGRSLAGN